MYYNNDKRAKIKVDCKRGKNATISGKGRVVTGEWYAVW